MATICKLPTELVELVCHARPSIIPNLRLACRDLHSKMMMLPFANLYFHELPVSVDPHSMSILLQISQRAHLARAVRKIRFTTCIRAEVDCREEAIERQTEFVNGDSFTSGLMLILSSMPKLESLVCGGYLRGIGGRQGAPSYTFEDITASLVAIMKVLTAGQAKITTIEAGSSEGLTIRWDCLQELWQDARSKGISLPSVRSLSLWCHERHSTAVPRSLSLDRFLRIMPNLARLDLGVPLHDTGRWIPDSFGDKIQELSLEGHYIGCSGYYQEDPVELQFEAASLVAALSKSPTFRKLTLTTFGNRGVTKAKECLRELLKLTSLEMLTLRLTNNLGARLCLNESCMHLPRTEADDALDSVPDDEGLEHGEEWRATDIPSDIENWIRCAHETRAACLPPGDLEMFL